MCGYTCGLLLLLTVALIKGATATAADPDFYELLGITRDADTREIRKGFKKVALVEHPDKKANDPEAHDKFLKINRAYEVLKDEDLRKKYDEFGEEGLKEDGPKPGGGYQSWGFYQDNFGIYDDDIEIVTLGRSEFEQSVQNTEDVWFINFYSTFCSHCHQLAPTWRDVASQLEGVIRIGAVNCQDDHWLCQNQGIRSYPSLYMYGGGKNKEKYQGDKNTKDLVKFGLKFLQYPVIELWKENFNDKVKEHGSLPWLVTFCGDGGDCLGRMSANKIAAMLGNIVNVAEINCHVSGTLCKNLNYSGGNYYFPTGQLSQNKGQEFDTLDPKELADEILKIQPDLKTLDRTEFKTAMERVKGSRDAPWLIHFVSGGSHDLELRKLPSILANMNIGRVDCAQLGDRCAEQHVKKYPSFAVFKRGGGHEIYHGRRNSAHDIAAFAKDSSNTPVTVLGPEDFPDRVMHGDKPWFVDFYSPTCPPCMRLLPEFRKASKHLKNKVNFGTVDCTTYHDLCQQYDIRSYPTTIMYNASQPHQYHGQHASQQIIEFIDETLSPSVINLDQALFSRLVAGRGDGDMWLIDFSAGSWCPPCTQLVPEWRRLAKSLQGHANIRVGMVDCDTYKSVCDHQRVTGYPEMRLYPMNQRGKGSRKHHAYEGWHRDHNSIKMWAFEFLPSPVVTLDPQSFVSDVLQSKEPWLVDFYAPWCGPCKRFAPEYSRVAEALEGQIKLGKVDCEMYRPTCQQVGIQAYPSVLYYKGKTKGMAQQRHNPGQGIENLDYNSVLQATKSFLQKRKQDRSHDEL